MSKLHFTGCQIICSKVVTADVTLNNDRFLITGIVYSPTGAPLPKAAVLIRVIDEDSSDCEITLGVTFTLSDGSYGISLPKIAGKRYQLIAYADQSWREL